jgi:hypothetical protein
MTAKKSVAKKAPAKKTAAKKTTAKAAPRRGGTAAKKSTPAKKIEGRAPTKYSVLVTVDSDDLDKGFARVEKALLDSGVASRVTKVTASVMKDGKTYSAWEWDYAKDEPKPGARFYGAPDSGRTVKTPETPDRTKPLVPIKREYGDLAKPGVPIKHTPGSKPAASKAAPSKPSKPLRKSAAPKKHQPEEIDAADLFDFDVTDMDASAEEAANKAAAAAVKKVAGRKPLRKKAVKK